MGNNFHILNGDALKDIFPEDLPGEIIICRECLVDGSVEGDTLDKLFAARAEFLNNADEETKHIDYFSYVVTEFEKIGSIPKDSEINLWFEDDLFCQVNMWFVFHLLDEYGIDNSLFLVHPSAGLQYGFAGMNKDELIQAFSRRQPVSPTDFSQLKHLWKNYQHNNVNELLRISTQLNKHYPFLLPAVKAHIELIPSEGNPGRPKQTLLNISNELNTKHFGTIFREFCKRESIYGFGDLQVKRMLEELRIK
ncbi:MAG: DUF1835 domain-containing protein [Ignavibacteriales bacterium]|nr:MAG: DUF1835 domain-containing protein [Ignavibacteriales bacterium]